MRYTIINKTIEILFSHCFQIKYFVNRHCFDLNNITLKCLTMSINTFSKISKIMILTRKSTKKNIWYFSNK